MASELQRLCDQRGVRIDARYGAVEVPDGWQSGTHPYQVTLRYQRRRLTVPFFMGPAHTTEPTAADVLSCLCSDATSVENAGSFEEWCSDLGYDTDSRKAEVTFKACERTARQLRVFLGEEFETFCRADH